MSAKAFVPAAIRSTGPARAELSGDLNHRTVADVLPQGLALLAQSGDSWTVNLAGVQQVSGVGVALLLEFLRAATLQNKTLYIEQIPEHMLPMIRISDLEPVFGPLLRTV